MKNRQYVRTAGAGQAFIDEAGVRSGAGMGFMRWEFLELRRDGYCYYVEFDGLPRPLGELPTGLEAAGLVIVTDTGTLDRPRAGSYRDGGATGIVSVFEKPTGHGTFTEWKLEVSGDDIDEVIALYNGIRDGSKKPDHAYRAAQALVRFRQSVHELCSRWARSGRKQ
jgi:hypothetical protein